MDFFSLLTPWAVLVVILFPLMLAERWVHQHLFGVVYLITKNKESATRAFYIVFLPGIFIHEFVQYMVAGALNVPIKKEFKKPRPQENGTLRLDFVVVERDKTDPVRAAIIAAAPFIVMMLIITELSTNILSLDELLAAWGKGDITVLWAELRELLGTGDFIIWFYLLFSIANSMIPKREDAHGWPIILGVMAVIVVIMLVIGLDAVLVETLAGPVTHTLELVNTALLLALLLDVIAIFSLGLFESVLERLRGIKMDYSGGENLTKARSAAGEKREPGSDAPYPKGQPLPSIYNFALPIPDPADRIPKPKPEPAIASTPETPPITVRPALASRSPLAEKSVETEKVDIAPEESPRPPVSRPGVDRPTPSTRPTGEFPRRTPVEEKPSEESPRPPVSRPGFDRPTPSTRPTGEFPRRTPVEEKPSEESPRPPVSRPGVDRPTPSTRPTGEYPRRAPTEESPRPPVTRPGVDRPTPSTRPTGEFPRRAPTEEKPSEESPRPARPSFQRPNPVEETQKPARPTGITRPPQEKPATPPTRRFTPAPRTSPFLLDNETADELDKELEYVDFDDDVSPPSEDE